MDGQLPRFVWPSLSFNLPSSSHEILLSAKSKSEMLKMQSSLESNWTDKGEHWTDKCLKNPISRFPFQMSNTEKSVFYETNLS